MIQPAEASLKEAKISKQSASLWFRQLCLARSKIDTKLKISIKNMGLNKFWLVKKRPAPQSVRLADTSH
ncbi:hypothetical protein OAG89_00580 [Pseudomonadales bacterium]|jgi:hypothetical protein|nr:hypothetical protein [Pseudomonadales bacterium]